MIAAYAVASCRPVQTEGTSAGDSGACLFITKVPGTPHVDENRTYRVCQYFNGSTGNLLADGSYCAYMNTEKGWLYPCKVDDYGNALDADGNIIPWDADDWFSRTQNGTEYALNMRPLTNESYTTLVVCSPARRLSVIDKKASPKEYAFRLDIDEEFYVSSPITDLPFEPSVLDGQYIYSDPILLRDRRSRINVVVMCGNLDLSYLHALHFRNVITTALYNPRKMVYVNPQTDRGFSDPFMAYTRNCYPEAGGQTVPGNILFVPDGQDDICLIKDSAVPEWNLDLNEGQQVTAIHQFPVFSLDYGSIDKNTGKYVYEEQIPELVIYSGIGGKLKSTVRLAANVEPMVEYTVIIKLSTASITAELIAADWDDVPQSINYGIALPVDTEEIEVDTWGHVDVDPGQGLISDSE